MLVQHARSKSTWTVGTPEVLQARLISRGSESHPVPCDGVSSTFSSAFEGASPLCAEAPFRWFHPGALILGLASTKGSLVGEVTLALQLPGLPPAYSMAPVGRGLQIGSLKLEGQRDVCRRRGRSVSPTASESCFARDAGTSSRLLAFHEVQMASCT